MEYLNDNVAINKALFPNGTYNWMRVLCGATGSQFNGIKMNNDLDMNGYNILNSGGGGGGGSNIKSVGWLQEMTFINTSPNVANGECCILDASDTINYDDLTNPLAVKFRFSLFNNNGDAIDWLPIVQKGYKVCIQSQEKGLNILQAVILTGNPITTPTDITVDFTGTVSRFTIGLLVNSDKVWCGALSPNVLDDLADVDVGTVSGLKYDSQPLVWSSLNNTWINATPQIQNMGCYYINDNGVNIIPNDGEIILLDPTGTTRVSVLINNCIIRISESMLNTSNYNWTAQITGSPNIKFTLYYRNSALNNLCDMTLNNATTIANYTEATVNSVIFTTGSFNFPYEAAADFGVKFVSDSITPQLTQAIKTIPTQLFLYDVDTVNLTPQASGTLCYVRAGVNGGRIEAPIPNDGHILISVNDKNGADISNTINSWVVGTFLTNVSNGSTNYVQGSCKVSVNPVFVSGVVDYYDIEYNAGQSQTTPPYNNLEESVFGKGQQALGDCSNVALNAIPTTGNVLTYDGTNWTDQASGAFDPNANYVLSGTWEFQNNVLQTGLSDLTVNTSGSVLIDNRNFGGSDGINFESGNNFSCFATTFMNFQTIAGQLNFESGGAQPINFVSTGTLNHSTVGQNINITTTAFPNTTGGIINFELGSDSTSIVSLLSANKTAAQYALDIATNDDAVPNKLYVDNASANPANAVLKNGNNDVGGITYGTTDPANTAVLNKLISNVGVSREEYGVLAPNLYQTTILQPVDTYALVTETTVGVSSGALIVQSGESDTQTGNCLFRSGDCLVSGNTGQIEISSGDATAGNSGQVSISTGSGDLGSSTLDLRTGSSSNGATGDISLRTGISTTSTSGKIELVSGNAGFGSGVIDLVSGDSVNGNAGDINLLVGVSDAIGGNIDITAGNVNPLSVLPFGGSGNVNINCPLPNHATIQRDGGSVNISCSIGVNGGNDGSVVFATTAQGLLTLSSNGAITSNFFNYENTVNQPNSLVSLKALQDNTITFTNKTFDDATTSFVDTTDPTKILQFECASIASLTTRTATMPDRDGFMVISNVDMPVILSTPSNNNKLIYDGSNWVNQASYGATLFITTSITTPLTQNVDTKLLGTTSLISDTTGIWTSGSLSNRLVYSGIQSKGFILQVSLSALSVGGNDRSMRLYITKNGTQITNSIQTVSFHSDREYNCSLLTRDLIVNTGDYYEVWVTNIESNDDLTAVRMNVQVMPI